MTRQILTLLCCSLFGTPLLAQVENVVEVENTYTPVVRDADKLNLLPEVKLTQPTHYPVQYETALQPTRTYVFQPADALLAAPEVLPNQRGFLSLAGGVRGNINFRGACQFNLSENDQLDLDASIRGHKGQVQHTLYHDDTWSSRYFTTRATAAYQHRFEQGFALQLRGNVESQVFNYMKEYVTPAANALPQPLISDKQHNWLTQVDAAVTPIRLGDFSLSGNLGFNSFLQRHVHFTPYTGKKPRESQFFFNATGRYRLDDANVLALDVNLSNMTYSYNTFRHYNSYTFTPRYTFTSDNLDLQLGFHIHANSGFRSHLRLAPAIQVRYHAATDFDLFLNADGGEMKNEFRHFAQITPYWGYNYNQQLDHQFDRLKATFGIDWKLSSDLFTRIYAGYDQSKNRAELYGASNISTFDGSLFHLNADVNYQPLREFDANAHVQFNGWATDAPDNMADDVLAWRPVVQFQLQANFNIAPRWKVTADYLLQTFKHDGVQLYRRPTTNNLSAAVAYTMPLPQLTSESQLSIFLRGDNLLNRNYDDYNAYRAQKITFLAGAAITF